MIRFTGSMECALTVKAVMDRLINEEDMETTYCEAFANCREQGLHIVGNAGRASFSENRNSDSIVVYPGQMYGDFGFTNIPNEGSPAWDNRRYFDYDDFVGAARFILTHITGHRYTK